MPAKIGRVPKRSATVDALAKRNEYTKPIWLTTIAADHAMIKSRSRRLTRGLSLRDKVTPANAAVAIAKRALPKASGVNPCPRAYLITVKLKPQMTTQVPSSASAGRRERTGGA